MGMARVTIRAGGGVGDDKRASPRPARTAPPLRRWQAK